MGDDKGSELHLGFWGCGVGVLDELLQQVTGEVSSSGSGREALLGGGVKGEGVQERRGGALLPYEGRDCVAQAVLDGPACSSLQGLEQNLAHVLDVAFEHLFEHCFLMLVLAPLPGCLMLFEPYDLAGIQLRNRIIRSATHEGLADANGRPTEKLKRKYLQLARGGVGAIITGYAGITQAGRCPSVGMLMIDRDELVLHYLELTAAVHASGTPIILQIAHCGRQTRRAVTGLPTVAPSAIRDRFFSEEVPHALADAEIEEIVEQFVQGVMRAQRAGFDGVQLHAAHGYLLAQFLSAHSNRRKDRWGGSIENRCRVVTDIIMTARSRVGDFPILVKLNAYDGRKRGMRVEEAAVVARLLECAGCSGLEVSCGVYEDGLSTVRSDRLPAEAAFAFVHKYKDYPKWMQKIAKVVLPWVTPESTPVINYNVEAARRIKESVSLPVCVVGGIRSLADMQAIVDSGAADLVSLCRPLIKEPQLVNKLRAGRQSAARCRNCGYCALGQEVLPLCCYDGKLPKRYL
jgi:2,4-dienoyl-CoA reductase-like NADH-dependent reductase (Old Yellow Enzyme family)